jgi:hypothetical protein
MDVSEIVPYLPPIAVSMGALLPVLISKPPFSVAENARVLVSCIMVLIVWLGYWAVYLPASRSFVLWWLGPLGLLASLGVLGVVSYAANRPSPPNAAGQTEPAREIDRPRYLYWYGIGLFLLAATAAIYTGPRGQVRVELDLTLSPEDSLIEVYSVKRVRKAGNPVPVDSPSTHGKRIQFLMDAEEFSGADEFQVDILVQMASKTEPRTMHAPVADKLKLIRPDAVLTYRIAAAPAD